MLFGFLIDISDVLNSDTILFAICITIGIFIVRYIVLKIFKVQTNPSVFIAPRGLITILLFLSIPLTQQIEQIDKSLIIQVIILSALIMKIGLMRYKKPQIENINESH
jgi:NhaP-type Na+/H+ or K+/H+ antiporter